MNRTDIYVSIDFDGTITEKDITDAIIQRFARPGWEEAERLWEEGKIGSKECLSAQIALVDAPLADIIEYVDSFSIDAGFKDFIRFLMRSNIRFGIISDGFDVFIKRILTNEGISGIPVYANRLYVENGSLKTSYPYASRNCSSGVCKAEVAATLGDGSPVIHVGDGRSDFCISERASLVYSKGKLTGFCRENGIPHIEFARFGDIRKSVAELISSPSPAREHGLTAPFFNEAW